MFVARKTEVMPLLDHQAFPDRDRLIKKFEQFFSVLNFKATSITISIADGARGGRCREFCEVRG